MLYGQQRPLATALALVMLALSYRRFRQQRWKMTELSYATAVLAHTSLRPNPTFRPKPEMTRPRRLPAPGEVGPRGEWMFADGSVHSQSKRIARTGRTAVPP